MYRWLLLGLALSASSANAWLVAWDSRTDWPAGTTVEACLNENCIAGITGTQQEFTLQIQPGSIVSAKARAQTIDGILSEWVTINTVYPDSQNVPDILVYREDEEQAMSFSLQSDTYRVSTNSGNGGYTTPGIDTTGADLLIMTFSAYSTLTWDSTYFSDNKSNNWNFLSVTGDALSRYGGIAYCIPTSVGANHTVSLAANSMGSYGSLAFFAFKGANQSNPYDTQTSANNANSPGSITPAVAGELFITRVTFGTYTSTPTVNSPFTATLSAGYSGGVRLGAGAAYYIAETNAAVDPTWTMGTGNRGVSMAAFKPAKSLVPFRMIDQAMILVR